MTDILYLTHRIPYPPNKGDKIRSWHLLKYLSKRYRVHLGTFIDDPDDVQYIDTVKELCAETHFVELNTLSARIGSLKALLANRPLTLDYYRNDAFQAWVNQVMKQYNIKRVLVFSSAMAQFVSHFNDVRRVIDFVDIDSDKWKQYAENQVWPMTQIYARESRVLENYERKIAKQFDASLFVSQTEADMFKKIARESAAKISYFNNGVDTEYFSPDRDYPNPYGKDEAPIVFTGAMDYWPNVDAVQWFAHDVFPAVLRERENASFYIVGSRPTNPVLALDKLPGIHVTGFVRDIRPYLAHARCAVAPLRIARGIQNKVLEGMSMGKVVVASPQAFEGIQAEHKKELLVASNAEQFFFEACDLITKPNEKIEQQARQRIEERYGWDSNLAVVERLLEQE